MARAFLKKPGDDGTFERKELGRKMITHREIVVRSAAVALCVCVTLGTGCGKKSAAPGAEGQADLSKSSDLFSQPVKMAVPEGNPSDVFVVVDGKDITRGEVNAEVAKTMEMASRRLPPERLAQMQDRFAQQATENLVLKMLLTGAVEKESVTVSDEEMTNAIGRFTESLPPGVTLADIIQRNRWTDEEFRKNLMLDLRINKLLEKRTENAAKPSEDEITKFYGENKEKFDVPETVSARHILIAAEPTDSEEVKQTKKAKAEQLRQALVGGADFAKLAADNSDCPSKARGGDLGTFARGQMVKPFEDAAFGQKVDEIGPVVETQFGFHIIQVKEHKDAHTMTLAEVHDRLAQALYSQNRQKAARDYVDTLKAQGQIEYKEPSVAPTSPSADLMPTPDAPPAAPPAAEPVPAPTAAQ